MNKKNEAYLSFLVPFFGLFMAIKGKNKGLNLIGFFLNLLFCIGACVVLYWVFPIQRFSVIGRLPLCNLKAERAMHFGNFVFPLCYRCTFLIVGIFASFAYFYIRKVRLKVFYIAFSFLFILPCFFDGLFQLVTTYTSTNFLRLFTGIFAGMGIGYIAYIPFIKWNLFIEKNI